MFNWTNKVNCANQGGQCKPNATSAYNRPGPSKPAVQRMPTAHDVVEQVHLIGAAPGEVTVVFMTQTYASSAVEFGKSSGPVAVAEGSSNSYSVMINPSGNDGIDDHHPTPGHSMAFCTPAAYQRPECFYTSPLIHSVTLKGLVPSTRYKYRPSPSSRWRFFRTPPAVGQPVSFGVFADVGRTEDSVATMQHLSDVVTAGKVDSLLLVGDLSYADGYAPAWDSYGQLGEFLHDSVPTAYAIGNHEVVNGLENFANFLPRYGWPSTHGDWSGSSFWYSFESGLAHTITLCSYCDYSVGSLQSQWLLADLDRVDRTRTPWLIVNMHVPFYSSNGHHNSYESDRMKASMESMLYAHKVDVILSGHVHSYERTAPVYQYQEVCDGPVQLVIGDGGNKEGPACPWNITDPTWSRFREFSFGHGVLSLVNDTHARWGWHRNQDGAAVEADVTWIRTSSTRCSSTPNELVV